MPTAVEQPVPTREIPPPTERLSPPGAFDGLKPRLLLGGNAINPDNATIPPITQEQLGNFKDRNYDLFDNASTNERKTWWSGKENNNFDRQKRLWTAQTTETFNGAKDWFEKNQQGKQWTALFAKLDINATSFTEQNAQALYARYFGTAQRGSLVKKYVNEVVNTYQQGNTIDYAGIQRDLKGIKWLANIFGETSGEVVTQLVDAEVALLIEPEALITAANQTEKVNNQSVARANRLEPDEKRLLKFLWENRTADTTPTPGPTPPEPQSPTPQARRRLPEGYQWHYERAANPRQFPQRELVETVHSPYNVAMNLQKRLPQIYGQKNRDELAQEIAAEQMLLTQNLERHGLTSERLSQMGSSMINHYKEFVQQAYGITLPQMPEITIFPMSGKTAEAYCGENRNAYAFVSSKLPIIFLDMDVIVQHARELTNKEFPALSKEELGNLIARLLNEINPHEYTHLMGDLAFWKLTKTDQEKKIQVLEPGKFGILVAKPKTATIEQGAPHAQFIERGRGLMEAITVELTNQWAKNMNAHLDINAYAPERQVLHALVNLLAREQNITQQEAFKKFALAYFTPKGFRDLAKDLVGRHKDQAGHIVYKRPHFQSIVYALMEMEAEAAQQQKTAPDYNLTTSYINNSLSQAQKDALGELARQGIPRGSRAHLFFAARRSLAASLGFTLELPQQNPPQETPQPPENAASIARRLLDETTGQATNERADLSTKFPRLVEKVSRLIDSNNPAIPEGESVVLSDVAWAMINQLSEQANTQNKEISFALQGITTFNNNDNPVIVGAYVAPAGVFANTITTDTDPAIHRANAEKLARNTNLERYFQDAVGSPLGHALAIYHIHPDSLGERYRGKPSTPDFDQIKTWFRDDPDTREYYWGVFTRHEGQLHMQLFRSTLDEHGHIDHKPISAKRESELP